MTSYSRVLTESISLSDGWRAKDNDTWIEVLSESFSISDSLPGTISPSILEEAPVAKIEISDDSGLLYTIEENIVEIRFEESTGLMSTQYLVSLWNIEDSYDIDVGDEIAIYLGNGTTYTKVLAGMVFDVDKTEDTLLLKGFDWSDYLQGPLVTRGYRNYWCGKMIQDMIDGSISGLGGYAEQLDATNLPDTGCQYTSFLTWDNIPLPDVITEVLTLVKDEVGEEYRLRVDTEKQVWMDLQSIDPLWKLTEEDVITASIREEETSLITAVRVIGEKEIMVDDMTEVISSTCDIATSDWIGYLTGTWKWDLVNDWLIHTGGVTGLVVCQLGMSWKTGSLSDIHPRLVEVNMKQVAGSIDTSIYAFRQNPGAFSDGYRLRLTDTTLELSKPSGLIKKVFLPSAEQPAVDTWFVITFEKNGTAIRCSLNDKDYILENDNDYTAGGVWFEAKSGETTRYTFLYVSTDDEVDQTVTDSTLATKFGTKVKSIRKPEIRLNNLAYSWAETELERAKVSLTTGSVRLDGTTELTIGDITRLYLRDWDIWGTDYQITEITQKFQEHDWTTELRVEEYSPELSDILTRLQELSRAIPPTLYQPAMHRTISVKALVEDIQVGTGSTDGSGDGTVTFPEEFVTTPKVVVTGYSVGAVGLVIDVVAKTTTTFDVKARKTTGITTSSDGVDHTHSGTTGNPSATSSVGSSTHAHTVNVNTAGFYNSGTKFTTTVASNSHTHTNPTTATESTHRHKALDYVGVESDHPTDRYFWAKNSSGTNMGTIKIATAASFAEDHWTESGQAHSHTQGVTGGPSDPDTTVMYNLTLGAANAVVSIASVGNPSTTTNVASSTHTHDFTSGGASAYNHTHTVDAPVLACSFDWMAVSV